MTNDALSQSQLGDYAECPQYYQFDREWSITLPDEQVRFRRRGTVLHNTVEQVWLELHPDVDAAGTAEDDDNPVVAPMEELPVSRESVRERAREIFERQWETHLSTEHYQLESEYEYDRRVCRAGIESYLAPGGDGLEHLRRAVTSEGRLTFDRRGRRFLGILDLVLAVDGGLRVVDLKTSAGIPPKRYQYHLESDLEDHIAGTDHKPRRVKRLLQAAIYREAATRLECYEEGMAVEFAFYGLLEEVEPTPALDGVTPVVTGDEREVTDFLDEHDETIWELIATYAEAIERRDFEIDDDRWEHIYDDLCDRCKYNSACPKFLSREVRAIARRSE